MNLLHTSRERRHDVGPLDGAAGKQGDGDVGNGPARERGHRSAAAPGRRSRDVSAAGDFPRFAAQGDGRSAGRAPVGAGKAGGKDRARGVLDAASRGSGMRIAGSGGRIAHQGAMTTSGSQVRQGATALQGTTTGNPVRQGATTPSGDITPHGTMTDTRLAGRRQGAGVSGSGQTAVGAACAGVFASRARQSALPEGETTDLPFPAGALFSGRR